MRIALMIASALIFFMICIGTAFSAFDDIGIGARPLGMGGAFVAIADDANAVMYNPAGLGFITNIETGFTHVRMFSGVVNYNYAGAVIPLGAIGTLGASFGMLDEESNIYSERNLAFSYSTRIINNLSLGASFKMLGVDYDSDDQWVSDNPYFAKTSASSFTLDAGLLAKPVSELGIGISGENLIPADVSISESEEEKVPMNLRFGIAYKLSQIADSAQQPALKEVLDTTSISLECALRKEREVNAVKFRAGIEAWFADQMVGLRAGYNMKKVKSRSSSITLGGSIRIPANSFALRFDYAVQIFGGDIEDNLAHRVSLAVSF